MILGSQGTAKNFRVVSLNGGSYEALPHSQLSINFPKTECERNDCPFAAAYGRIARYFYEDAE